ncbi:hypothetical protein PR048_016174 [Dryococelus australis]|uniref:Uncharacterized protein n=1 Tax=Dryococelus australis TaxID=614101 RepID=A0ABQ9HJA3_9NEOP|nr:hypothetical protein PR048_016174 [Dryococelus australis]
MRVIDVNMEHPRDKGAGKGDPRENPPTNGIVRHDSHLRKFGDPRRLWLMGFHEPRVSHDSRATAFHLYPVSSPSALKTSEQPQSSQMPIRPLFSAQDRIGFVSQLIASARHPSRRPPADGIDRCPATKSSTCPRIVFLYRQCSLWLSGRSRVPLRPADQRAVNSQRFSTTTHGNYRWGVLHRFSEDYLPDMSYKTCNGNARVVDHDISVNESFIYECLKAVHVKLYAFHVKKLRKLNTISAYTREKVKSKYRNCIRLGRASQNQSSDTHKTLYDRVKRCWERKKKRKKSIKASELVNLDILSLRCSSRVTLRNDFRPDTCSSRAIPPPPPTNQPFQVPSTPFLLASLSPLRDTAATRSSDLRFGGAAVASVLHSPHAPFVGSLRELPLELEQRMERCRNETAGETGDHRENPPTSGIVRHDPRMRKSGDPAREENLHATPRLRHTQTHLKTIAAVFPHVWFWFCSQQIHTALSKNSHDRKANVKSNAKVFCCERGFKFHSRSKILFRRNSTCKLFPHCSTLGRRVWRSITTALDTQVDGTGSRREGAPFLFKGFLPAEKPTPHRNYP